MNNYHIVGLRSEKQAKRIRGRFCDALNIHNHEDIYLDIEHSTIALPEDIRPYVISLISSFEQVSIVESKYMKKIYEDEHEHKNDSDHGHTHDHSFGEGKSAERKMLIVFFLNLFFSIAEFFFGSIFSSQAILSDAVHDLGDAMSIGLAYFFEKISNKEATHEFSYGYRRFSLLGALVTSVVLIVGGTLIIIDTIPKLLSPSPVHHTGVFWVAVGAIMINGISVLLMSQGESANERLLNIHLFEDLFGWLLVLLMSIVLRYTDWYILDPLLSLAIAGWILYMTIPEFIRISKIFLQAVPDNINLNKLREDIEALEDIQVLSHFHIWSTDGDQHMMSLTVTTPSNSQHTHEQIKQKIRRLVLEYELSHITIEILYDPDELIKKSISCEG